MKVLYNYKPYDKPRRGLFRVEDPDGIYTKQGWNTKSEEHTIIGETKHSYITELKPYSNKLHGEPECLLPLGVHKSRLQAWLTGQLQIF